MSLDKDESLFHPSLGRKSVVVFCVFWGQVWGTVAMVVEPDAGFSCWWACSWTSHLCRSIWAIVVAVAPSPPSPGAPWPPARAPGRPWAARGRPRRAAVSAGGPRSGKHGSRVKPVALRWSLHRSTPRQAGDNVHLWARFPLRRGCWRQIAEN